MLGWMRNQEAIHENQSFKDANGIMGIRHSEA
jgi:hypothetical protein